MHYFVIVKQQSIMYFLHKIYIIINIELLL
jgi:hypothetical protein